MRDLLIRAALIADAPAMSTMISRAVRIANSADYEPPTIELICSTFTIEKIIEKQAVRDVFVALDDEMIIGTISLGIHAEVLECVEPPGSLIREIGFETFFGGPRVLPKRTVGRRGDGQRLGAEDREPDLHLIGPRCRRRGKGELHVLVPLRPAVVLGVPLLARTAHPESARRPGNRIRIGSSGGIVSGLIPQAQLAVGSRRRRQRHDDDDRNRRDRAAFRRELAIATRDERAGVHSRPDRRDAER
jgi:hypothetical protein